MKLFNPKILKYKILFFVVPTVVVIDQWTKQAVLDRFRLGESISIISNYFNLTYVQNRGAAFGFCNNCPPVFRDNFFLVVPVIALMVILYMLHKLPDRQKWVATALSLIVSGAIGNLIDRIRLGYVVDFLDFHWNFTYHWPAFNVADSCIVVGVGIMFSHSIFPNKLGGPIA